MGTVRREIVPTYLLDTCVLIWIAIDKEIREPALNQLKGLNQGQLFVSPISAWEIAQLVKRQRLILTIETIEFFHKFCGQHDVRIETLSPAVLVSAVNLPHSASIKDPADRILISTARRFRHTLITRDKQILEYGKSGHVSALRC